MHKFLLSFLLLSFANANGQNLVPNPGFETVLECNDFGAGILHLKAPPWNAPDDSSPDLYNSCSVLPNWTFPSNQFGYQYPHTGNGYAGTLFYNAAADYREFLQVKLKSALIANQNYCVSFYVSMANSQYTACNNMGMYISSTEIATSSLMSLGLLPQIKETSVIKDTVNWIPVQGNYLASGGEQYIIIGNFSLPQNMDTFHFPATIAPASYYYVDDVDIHKGPCGIVPTPLDTTLEIITSTETNMISITGQNGKGYVQIFNDIGQLLYKTSFIQSLTINANFLPCGVYFLSFSGGNHRVIRKFLKMR